MIWRSVLGVSLSMLAIMWFAHALPAAHAADQTPALDYATAIRPIFQTSCAQCHLDGNRKGALDLGSRDSLLKGGESEEPAIVPHDPSKSRIMEVLTSDDPDVVMPKKGKHLTAEQVALIKTWIDRGAPWGNAPGAEPKYVAPLEPRHPALPEGTAGNPIDRLLTPYFAAHKIDSSGIVDDRTYARRVYLDVIGMLPAPDDLDAFIANTDPDKRAKLVDKLLGDKQRYAENWMSFWDDCLRNDYRGTGYIDGGQKADHGVALQRALQQHAVRSVRPHADRSVAWGGRVYQRHHLARRGVGQSGQGSPGGPNRHAGFSRPEFQMQFMS